MIRRFLALLLALAPTGAGAFELAFPLDCTLGETCFVQQYVDRDPGPGATDFTCGPRSYDGHKGTDFALPSLAAMTAGVTVRAAGPGIVRGTRSDMPDIASNAPDAPAIAGRDCGNGVLIEHDGGWQTQYCHMKRASITVQTGDIIATGAPLGQVGLSGRTEFPHLHLSVSQNDRVIDPFNPTQAPTCGQPSAPPLWVTPIAYAPGGLISVGFSTAVPDFSAIKAGLPSLGVLPTDAPSLVVWAYAYGSRAQDVIEITITGPEGEILRHSALLDRTQAQLFRAAGKRIPANDWPAGQWSGTVRMLRDGTEIDRAAALLTIGN